jgi:hypothetical protein
MRAPEAANHNINRISCIDTGQSKFVAPVLIDGGSQCLTAGSAGQRSDLPLSTSVFNLLRIAGRPPVTLT